MSSLPPLPSLLPHPKVQGYIELVQKTYTASRIYVVRHERARSKIYSPPRRTYHLYTVMFVFRSKEMEKFFSAFVLPSVKRTSLPSALANLVRLRFYFKSIPPRNRLSSILLFFRSKWNFIYNFSIIPSMSVRSKEIKFEPLN